MGLMAFCSGPFWPDTMQVREIAAEELLRKAANGLAQELQRSQGLGHSNLWKALCQIAETQSFVRPAWAPSVGYAFRALKEVNASSLLLAATNLVLDFIESVEPFSCQLELGSPRRVKVDPLIFSLSTWISIDWHSPTLELRTNDASASLALDSPERRVVYLHKADSSSVGIFEDLGDIALLRGEYGGCFPPLDEKTISFGDRDSMIRSEISHARRCLESCAMPYMDWIFSMLRYAVPMTSPACKYASGSARDAPGVVSISPGSGPVKVAESLVHEGAHQYYFLLSRFTTFTNDTSGRQYYSPFVDCERPLDRILLAFHAAANVVSFYSLLEKSTAWKPEYHRDFDHGLADCHVLNDHLCGNTALTEAGLDLYEPIKDWLTKRSLI